MYRVYIYRYICVMFYKGGEDGGCNRGCKVENVITLAACGLLTTVQLMPGNAIFD